MGGDLIDPRERKIKEMKKGHGRVKERTRKEYRLNQAKTSSKIHNIAGRWGQNST